MSEEGKSIPVSLQCPKCAQIMSFEVERGKDATAVCPACRIPMKKLAKVVQSDRELDLEERMAALLVQVGELADQVEVNKRHLGLDFDDDRATTLQKQVQESSVLNRLDAAEEKIVDLEKYKANKLFKRQPKKHK